MLGLYLLGVVVAIPVAWILKRTAFSGPRSSFLLELPGYRIPRPRAVWQRMFLAGRSFLVRAGTVILIANLIIWALGYFPRRPAVRADIDAARTVQGWDERQYDAELAGAYLRDSYLGRIGHTIEPAIRPLGWDWRIGVGVVSSFPAREVIIATLGTVFNLGEVDEGAASMEYAVQHMTWEGTNKPLFTLPVALSLMVFFALSAQCFGTLAVIRRETDSWVWPTVSLVGMTTIALIGAWITTTAGRALGL